MSMKRSVLGFLVGLGALVAAATPAHADYHVFRWFPIVMEENIHYSCAVHYGISTATTPGTVFDTRVLCDKTDFETKTITPMAPSAEDLAAMAAPGAWSADVILDGTYQYKRANEQTLFMVAAVDAILKAHRSLYTARPIAKSGMLARMVDLLVPSAHAAGPGDVIEGTVAMLAWVAKQLGPSKIAAEELGAGLRAGSAAAARAGIRGRGITAAVTRPAADLLEHAAARGAGSMVTSAGSVSYRVLGSTGKAVFHITAHN